MLMLDVLVNNVKLLCEFADAFSCACCSATMDTEAHVKRVKAQIRAILFLLEILIG